MTTPQIIRLGEIEPIDFSLTERDGGIVTVATATFLVRDMDGTIMQTTGNATITNNGTVKVTISGIVDTTTIIPPAIVSLFTVGKTFEVQFTITIGSYTIIRSVYRKVGAA